MKYALRFCITSIKIGDCNRYIPFIILANVRSILGLHPYEVVEIGPNDFENYEVSTFHKVNSISIQIYEYTL